MLEGLEAVEVNLSICKSIIDFRIDANTYKKDYLKSELLLKSLPNTSIDDISTSVQNFGAYSLCNFINFKDSGIPFLMTQNIRHNYIDWNIEKFVDNESHKMLWKSHCKKGQVLVTMAGEYLGRVAVYDKTEICSSNQAIAKVSLKKGQNPYIVSTFLNSKHGQNQINRFKTITGQPNINMALIKSLSVPIFTSNFQTLIESLIKDAEKKRDLTAKKYQQAETILLETLGLKDFQLSTDPINVKGFKESFLSTGRLDAEYYQKKYEEIEEYIKRFKLGFTTVSHEFALSKEIIDRTRDFYNYTEISDINVSDGSVTYNELPINDLPDNGKMVLKEGQIIISKVRPYRGAIGIIRECPQNYVGSGAFTILYGIRDYKKEVLQTLLRSKPYQELIMKYNVGSSYPVVKDEDILNLPIPKLDNLNQQEIAVLVEECFRLKKQSEQLLETAKRAVEIAIEDNEEMALKFIKINIQNA